MNKSNDAQHNETAELQGERLPDGEVMTEEEKAIFRAERKLHLQRWAENESQYSTAPPDSYERACYRDGFKDAWNFQRKAAFAELERLRVMLERTAVIQFWNDDEIYQRNDSSGKWMIEAFPETYDSALEAYEATNGVESL